MIFFIKGKIIFNKYRRIQTKTTSNPGAKEISYHIQDKIFMLGYPILSHVIE